MVEMWIALYDPALQSQLLLIPDYNVCKHNTNLETMWEIRLLLTPRRNHKLLTDSSGAEIEAKFPMNLSFSSS